ncbi:MAG: SPOR domain-containing protein [Gracilimonas sp.]
MHIDHSKLVELLVETSGIEKEKIESQLSDLLEEVIAAIEEGDAYEVDGLGVFSGIGNNVIFIPSDELSTEINYKYVGMEPIEMDDAPAQEPSEPKKEEEDTDVDDDPFAGLLDDVEDETEPAASFELDVPEEEETVANPEMSSEEKEDKGEDDEAPFDLDDEEAPEEEKPGPDKWGIDTYKDDSAETMFSGLLGEQEEKETEKEDHFDALFEQEEESPKESSFIDDLLAEEEQDDDQEEPAVLDKIDVSESDTEDEKEDFDDPFKALADEEEEDELTDPEPSKKKEEEEEVIPVIKNLSSESKKKEKESKVKEEEADKEQDAKPKKKKKATAEPKSPPVMLWILLIIILLGGGTYGLGYYGIVNIPGITPEPQIAATNNQPQTTPPETTQPETTPQEQQQTPAEPAEPEQTQEAPEETSPEPEQESEAEVRTTEEAPADQPTYGMTGVPVSAANNGYTIVVYSLSRESNAEAKQRELSEDGYRVLVATVPSQQYGTLWRVSLGQFRTMRDAALAAEDLDQTFSENYFITKIQ